jgi:hypothetical protein
LVWSRLHRSFSNFPPETAPASPQKWHQSTRLPQRGDYPIEPIHQFRYTGIMNARYNQRFVVEVSHNVEPNTGEEGEE